MRSDVVVGEQSPDAFFDVVADGAYRLDVLTGRVGQLPVLVTLAGDDGAGITATHRDHHVGGVHDLVGPEFRELAGDVDADLGHRCDCGRVDLVAGFGAARPRHGIV